jgi:hypothetical protein
MFNNRVAIKSPHTPLIQNIFFKGAHLIKKLRSNDPSYVIFSIKPAEDKNPEDEDPNKRPAIFLHENWLHMDAMFTESLGFVPECKMGTIRLYGIARRLYEGGNFDGFNLPLWSQCSLLSRCKDDVDDSHHALWFITDETNGYPYPRYTTDSYDRIESLASEKNSDISVQLLALREELEAAKAAAAQATARETAAVLESQKLREELEAAKAAAAQATARETAAVLESQNLRKETEAAKATAVRATALVSSRQTDMNNMLRTLVDRESRLRNMEAAEDNRVVHSHTCLDGLPVRLVYQIIHPHTLCWSDLSFRFGQYFTITNRGLETIIPNSATMTFFHQR